MPKGERSSDACLESAQLRIVLFTSFSQCVGSAAADCRSCEPAGCVRCLQSVRCRLWKTGTACKRRGFLLVQQISNSDVMWRPWGALCWFCGIYTYDHRALCEPTCLKIKNPQDWPVHCTILHHLHMHHLFSCGKARHVFLHDSTDWAPALTIQQVGLCDWLVARVHHTPRNSNLSRMDFHWLSRKFRMTAFD